MKEEKFKMEMNQYDFSGWATRNDLLCGDGRTIKKNAFKADDGKEVPLIWNHDHSNPEAVLGHAVLENREDGVYAYCKFNDTKSGKNAKKLVHNGDVRSLSIWANKLKQIGGDVIHGTIRELSLVLAGANPGAYIDFVMAHGEDEEDSVYVNYDESAIVVYHSDESEGEQVIQHSEENEEEENKVEEQKNPEQSEVLEHSEENKEETVQDVFNTLTEKQKTVVYALIGQALENNADDENDDESKGGNTKMKHNVFDQEEVTQGSALSHADLDNIVEMAKKSNYGSFKVAMEAYCEDNKATLAHGFEKYEDLIPDPKLITPGAPEIIRDKDISWVDRVMNKIHKSPYPRVRTRHADARAAELKAKGYKKGEEKQLTGAIKLLNRKTEPQTVYVKDELHRDDILDIDFDTVAYVWSLMNDTMKETLALAILIGDQRDDNDPDKIHQENIRSILNDEELYAIHTDVDVAAAKAELQGTNTSANFGENYIYAEAMITAALYAREQYKGTGTPDYYCAPHSINIMLLARDLNGRRIYDSKADLAKALNVNEIIEIEQLEGVTRKLDGGAEKKLHGIFVNLADYQLGNVKAGDITKFEDFDIDFNKYKYLMETKKSGSLIKPFSAIVLEEPVESVEG